MTSMLQSVGTQTEPDRVHGLTGLIQQPRLSVTEPVDCCKSLVCLKAITITPRTYACADALLNSLQSFCSIDLGLWLV